MSLSSFISDFQDKHILIFGLGRLGGGVGAVHSFQKFSCRIRISDQLDENELSHSLAQFDQTNIDALSLGRQHMEDIEWADLIVKNPAVPMSNPFMQEAVRLQKHITTEAALFLKYTSTLSVGITGTRGKTTTTMLAHHLIQQGQSRPVLLGGNIKDTGALPLLFEETEDGISVLELSSFALEGCHWEKVSPDVAAITNLYPDHLNRYDSLEQYAVAKVAICEYQADDQKVFVRKDNSFTPLFAQHAGGKVVELELEKPPKSFALKGEHNQWNWTFASHLAQAVGVDKKAMTKAVSTFKGAPYRQEVVGEVDGTTFINDSTSTTPEAVMAALNTFPEATFIIGGTTKHLPLEELVIALKKHKGQIVFLKGSGTEELISLYEPKAIMFNSLDEAFKQSVQTKSNSVVFSPGFTSFELFKNEFDRAEQFNALVKSLAQQ